MVESNTMPYITPLVSRFNRIKEVLQWDFKDDSDYYKDYAHAQLTITNAVLDNYHTHGYTRKGVLLFLAGLNAENYLGTNEIIDRSFFVQSFNGFIQSLSKEISLNKLAGFYVRFL